jgi:hypothetical protein
MNSLFKSTKFKLTPLKVRLEFEPIEKELLDNLKFSLYLS